MDWLDVDFGITSLVMNMLCRSASCDIAVQVCSARRQVDRPRRDTVHSLPRKAGTCISKFPILSSVLICGCFHSFNVPEEKSK
jgi:hypothetical protein